MPSLSSPPGSTAPSPLSFAGQRLRGRNFKGQDLTGADFSGADIRGTNFTNAVLREANFTGAKAGVQRRWVVGQFVISFVLSGVMNLIAVAINAAFITVFFTPDGIKQYTIFPGLALLFVNAVVIYAIARQGLTVKAMGTIAVAGVVAGARAGAGAGAGAITGTVAGAFAGAVAGAVAVAVAGVVAGVGVGAFAGATTGVVAGAVAGARVGARVGAVKSAVEIAVAVEIAILLLSAYVAWRVSKEDEKFTLSRSIGVALGAIGGTSFRGADLTKANFTEAILKSTNFNHSKQKQTLITHTCWKNAKKLDRARVGDSILSNPAVRQLLTSGNGINQFYLRANLRGANLNGSQLNGANLKWADLSGATLQGADLQNAILTETLAIGTNFTGAYLTGACLESWNIDHTTQLEAVNCDFVFLLEQPNRQGSRERRPHDPDAIFAEGDFTKLYKKMINVVQVLLRRGINREAFTEAFANLMQEHPDLSFDSIQSIEKKGEDVLMTLTVPETANKEQIQRDFLNPYETKLHQLEAKVEELNSLRSSDMKEIALTLAQKNTQINNQVLGAGTAMNENIDQSQNIKVGGDMNITATHAVVNLRDISGTVTNTIQQLPDPDGARPNIKTFLTQLQTAIEADTYLSTDDKAEALEQVKVLAEAGQNPQDGMVQKAANTAAKILKGTVAALPSTTALVEAVTKLLPLITKFFGF